MLQEQTIKEQTIKEKMTYNCDKCGFFCDKNSKLVAHFKTQKHITKLQKEEVLDKKELKSEECVENTIISHNATANANALQESYECICDKSYKSAASLTAHKKICKSIKIQELVDKTNKNIAKQEQQMLQEPEQTNEEKEIIKLTRQVKQLQSIISTQNEEIIELVKVSADDPNAADHITKLQTFLQEQCREVVQLKEFLIVLIKKIANEASIISAGASANA
jgi:hypothetical protein